MAIYKRTAGITALWCLIWHTCAQTTTASARWPTQTFVTEPGLHPPQAAINHTDDSALAPGLVIFSQDGTYAPESVALIMDRKGELVWQTDPAIGDLQYLSPFTLFGDNVLVGWAGTSDNVNGDSFGTVTVWNDSYEPIYNITLSDPQFEQLYGRYDSLLNQHEVYITSWGTFLGLVYDPVPANLSAVGGPENGWIRDGVVVEIDVETNELLFVWRASDFIPIEDSVDVHLNSVAKLNGNIVVSSRHTFQAIYIDRQTGGVKWIIQNTSSGLLARIDENTRHVHFVQRYADPDDAVSVSSGGSYQPQPNGHVVVCHASQPVVKEYAEDGSRDPGQTQRSKVLNVIEVALCWSSTLFL
ncbi:hypothetical protein LQW54_002457 [Pestalotiopsis sp. IQ-011]